LSFDLSQYDAARDGTQRDLALTDLKEAPCAATEQDGLRDAIVVCGSRHKNSYRLPPLASQFGGTENAGLADLHLGDNAVVGLRADTAMIGNAPSNRMMVTYKLKF
jgi:hypothetical protein